MGLRQVLVDIADWTRVERHPPITYVPQSRLSAPQACPLAHMLARLGAGLSHTF